MLKERSDLDDDLLRYKELLKRADELEKDIPQRRVGKRRATQTRPKSTKEQPPKRVKREKKVKSEPQEPNLSLADQPSLRTRSRRTRSQTAQVKIEENEERIVREEVEVKKERQEKRRVQRHESPKLELPCPPRPKFRGAPLSIKKEHVPPTFLRLKVQNYEDHLLVSLSYSDLVRIVKEDGGKSVDFGMLLNLLPKNVAYEKKRFAYDHTSELDLLLDRRLSFSDDIDRFFRLLSGNSDSKVASVPLV